MYAHRISMCQKVRQIRCLYYISIASSVQTEKAKKIYICHTPTSSLKRNNIGTGKSKGLAVAVLEEVDFLCGQVGSSEKGRIDMKLENACMKQKIVGMMQEMADMKLEKAGMKLEINANIWSATFCQH